jgi:hypothetical protein
VSETAWSQLDTMGPWPAAAWLRDEPLRDEPTNRVSWWSANSPYREASGWAGRITGPWWALGILVLAPMITLVTLTLGRGGQAPRASEDGAAASAPAVSARTAAQARKDRQWTSA